MLEDEARWKKRLHAGWATPRAVIESAVLRAAGVPPRSMSLLVGGEVNEVWAVETKGDDLILRISHAAPFAAEHWAAEQSRLAGVPVPEILLVEDDLEAHAQRVAIWVQRRAPGRPLDAHRERATDLTRASGAVLAGIHSVRTHGHGPIDGCGTGQLTRFADHLAWSDEVAKVAVRSGIGRSEIEDAVALVDVSDHLWMSPRLLHGDWLPEHVFVEGQRVTGVLDFGGACSGDPAYDLSYWNFFRELDGRADALPTSALIEGYRRAAAEGEALDVRLALCTISKSLKHLAYYAKNGRHHLAHYCRDLFIKTLPRLRDRYPDS